LNERLCDDKPLDHDLKRVCKKEVTIQQADCRNKKMCELKLGFLQTRCIDSFNEQAYGVEEMTKEKVIDVGKCFTRILRDHMKCKDRVNETTKIAIVDMKKQLEKESEMVLHEAQLEQEHLEEEKRKAIEEAEKKIVEFEEVVIKAEDIVDNKKVVELVLAIEKEIVELVENKHMEPEKETAEEESVKEEVVEEENPTEAIAPLTESAKQHTNLMLAL